MILEWTHLASRKPSPDYALHVHFRGSLVHRVFILWHSENVGALRSTSDHLRSVMFPVGREAGAVAEVAGRDLRTWRESQGWDVPRLARELRKAARETGEDIAAHSGLVKMIARWEKGEFAPRERYLLLYRRLGFRDGPPDSDRASALAARLAALPGEDEIRRRAADPDAAIEALHEAIALLGKLAGLLEGRDDDDQ